MGRRAFAGVGLVVAVVGFSLVRGRPLTEGERLLGEMERSLPRGRAGLLVLDYLPDEVAVGRAMREVAERGSGVPVNLGGVGVGGTDSPGARWSRTADALFFWSAPAKVAPLRAGLEGGHERLVAAFARGPFDDASTDAAFRSAFSQIAAMTDEALFLAWVNADRGVLAAIDDRAGALREALLLLAARETGSILAFDCAGRHVYVVPQSGTDEFTWCEIQAYDAGGALTWIGMLRVKEHPPAERVRVVAAAMAREALGQRLNNPVN